MVNPSQQTDKPDHSGLDRDELARICKAMGHPIRMQIIQFLKAETQCFCGELVSRLPLAQSTVSQHLKTLKEAGVIIGTVEGPGTCYCLNRPLLASFKTSIGWFID